MKGEKDEGKLMVPLFPGLHISDGDKGGPRAPPRNKMALFEEYNAHSEGSKIESRSRSMLPIAPSCSTFVSQASSSSNNVAGAKRKLRPTLATTNECPHSSEWYYPHCSPHPSSSTNPMTKAKCVSVKPQENDFPLPSFLQSGKAFNHRNFYLHRDKEKVSEFCSVSSGKLHSALLKLSNEAKREDRMMEHHPNLGEENSKLSQTDLIKRYSDDKDCVASKVGIAFKTEEITDDLMEGSIPGLNLTTDEVVRVSGQRLFLKARKIMVHQQRVFSLQMFELHRLITVQRLIASSPEILHENNFDPNKPPIKFPPMNKLLYVSRLDTSPSIAKTKTDALKSDPVTDGLLPLPKSNVEKGHLAHPLEPKTLGPLSMPIDSRIAPWCFHPPPGNQWLIPVRSPSEGLIYKPYPGPCFPTVGFLGPVYGNCGSVSISPLGGTAYSLPQEHGSGGFDVPELSKNYLQPCPMPSINATCSNHETKPTVGIEDCAGNLHSSKEGDGPGSPETSHQERLERDALSLFPTTPSLLKDQRNEQRVEAIKVVPHNRNSASASAARIFQSIQEERRKHE